MRQQCHSAGISITLYIYIYNIHIHTVPVSVKEIYFHNETTRSAFKHTLNTLCDAIVLIIIIRI